MKKKRVYRGNLFYCFLISFVLIGTTFQGTGFGSGGEPGSGGDAPIIRDIEVPSTTLEAQALKDGMTLMINIEEALGDTGKPGLGGERGTKPLILQTVDEKVPASTNDAQDLRDSYAVVVYAGQGVGDTGKPGLGGYTGSEPQNPPVEIKGTVTHTNQK